MILFKPENLDLGGVKYELRYYYLLHTLFMRRCFDKEIIENQFIPLHAQTIKRVIGKNYRKFIDNLIQWGILESDGQYIPNEKSIGFRISKKYNSAGFKPIEVTDQFLIDKINQHKKELNKPAKEKYPILWDNLQHIEIDFKKAFQWIENNAETSKQYNSYLGSIEAIRLKDWFFAIGEKANRLFYNIAGLKRESRQFLRYKNQPLFEVDIANSQPLFLNTLIQNFLKKANNISRGLDSYYGNIIILSYDALKETDTSFIDLALYQDLTQKAEFYKFLQKEMNYQGSYDVFKVDVFSKIFYNAKRKNQSTEWKQFKKIFPTVSKAIEYFQKDDYRDLAIKLQQAESDLMLNKVVPKLAKENIYCLSVHDSLLVLEKDIPKTVEVIKREFKTSHNLEVTLKIKGV